MMTKIIYYPQYKCRHCGALITGCGGTSREEVAKRPIKVHHCLGYIHPENCHLEGYMDIVAFLVEYRGKKKAKIKPGRCNVFLPRRKKK